MITVMPSLDLPHEYWMAERVILIQIMGMLVITIYGIGSSKHRLLAERVMAAVQAMRIPVRIQHVEDVDQFMKNGIMEIPAVTLNSQIISQGRVPGPTELRKLILEKYSLILQHSKMNPYAPVSEIMTKDVISVRPDDHLLTVRNIFRKNSIHHIPVVEGSKLLGIISKMDYQLFAFTLNNKGAFREEDSVKLKSILASELMTKQIAKLKPDDKISVAAHIFKENLFHAIPIVDHGELVGILTTFDLLNYSFANP